VPTRACHLHGMRGRFERLFVIERSEIEKYLAT